MSPMLANIFFSLLIAFPPALAATVPTEQLFEAAANGNVVSLRKHKKAKVDFNTQDAHGLSPLMQAVANGHSKAVDYLLSQKVDLELKNENGDTALAMALGNDQDEIAVQLIKAGARMDVLAGEDKNTLTFIAASTNSVKSLELLISKSPEQLNTKNKNGDTPLHESARYGSEKTLQLLLQAGANKSLKNNEGKTPLEIAESIQNEIAVKLLK